MPSFRAQLNITGLRPGNQPEAVMEAAVAAVGAAHIVEANQLDVVAGVPRITVRFTVDANAYAAENRQALQAGANMRHAVEGVATTARLAVLRRSRGKWAPVG
ncbi:hypothetical protein E4J89_15565 [Arthrobacter sp. CAU 1506]|uniref:hypothetical protein n=1 Tax=Arthrobacter sp. CAU 1506 TaxID=2560052 RepID=UPI0010AC1B1C|nr:hypothetical protein [Arthrobacter sp. CAU 1506]TJY67306.1 hypothetical protein E4J89_15565 [Arthrobacter sp. CAU 1506]